MTDGIGTLIAAVSAGDVAAVEAWLTQGHDPAEDDQEVLSPLFAAVPLPLPLVAVKIVKTLLAAGWPVDARDSRHNTPLLTAATRGNHDVMRCLLEANADVNARNTIGVTPLIASLNASAASRRRTVQQLLESGAEVNHRPLQGSCPLFIVCRNRTLSSYLSDLIQMKVDVTVLELGSTALHVACAHQTDPGCIVQLIEAGCDVNGLDSGGCTPLQRALLGPANLEVVRALIQHDADLTVVDGVGRTCLHQVVASGACPVLILQNLARQCDVDARDDAGLTPLHLLCASPSLTAVVLGCLLSVRPGVHVADHRGRTALHHLCGNPRASLAALRMLLEAGCEVNAEDGQGLTAFHDLCENIDCPFAVAGAHCLLQAGFNQALLEPLHLRLADCWMTYGLAARHVCLVFAGVPASRPLYRWRLTSLLQYPASLDKCRRSAVSPLEFALRECRHVASKGQGRLADPNDTLRQLTSLLDIIQLYVAMGTLTSTSDSLYKDCLNDIYQFIEHLSIQPTFNTGYEVINDSVSRCQNITASLTSYTSGPGKLADICRLKIYITLFPLPCKKVNALNIPKRMKDYIIFSDL